MGASQPSKPGARPPAKAILPTPASPTKIGLFFLRRHKFAWHALTLSLYLSEGQFFPHEHVRLNLPHKDAVDLYP